MPIPEPRVAIRSLLQSPQPVADTEPEVMVTWLVDPEDPVAAVSGMVMADPELLARDMMAETVIDNPILAAVAEAPARLALMQPIPLPVTAEMAQHLR